MEFGLLIKFCFPIIRFRIKATKNKAYLPFNNKLKSNVIQINFSSLIDEFLLSI